MNSFCHLHLINSFQLENETERIIAETDSGIQSRL